MAQGSKLLQTYLAPLEKYLKRDDIVDICINEPGKVWMQTIHGNPPWIVQTDKSLTQGKLMNLAEHLANAQGQVFNEVFPLLFTTIPEYDYRILCIGGSAVQSGFCLSIRTSNSEPHPLSDYFDTEPVEKVGVNKYAEMMKLPTDAAKVIYAVENGMTLACVGGTGTGKTSVLRTLIPHIPLDKRIITIEDSAELVIPHPNHVRLLKAKMGTDTGKITYESLINAALRLNPDVVILGEIDIENTIPFLRMINTGHAGAMTTLHADDAEKALDALAMNAALKRYDYATVKQYALKALDVFVVIHRKFNHFHASVHCLKAND